MYRLIVFDLDGTLVDSRRDIAESANALLEAFGARPLPEETIGRMVGEGAETLLVGDSIVDWRTARNASTPVCLARYGFGFEGFPLDEIDPADRVIDAPADLLAL